MRRNSSRQAHLDNSWRRGKTASVVSPPCCLRKFILFVRLCLILVPEKTTNQSNESTVSNNIVHADIDVQGYMMLHTAIIHVRIYMHVRYLPNFLYENEDHIKCIYTYIHARMYTVYVYMYV